MDRNHDDVMVQLTQPVCNKEIRFSIYNNQDLTLPTWLVGDDSGNTCWCCHKTGEDVGKR